MSSRPKRVQARSRLRWDEEIGLKVEEQWIRCKDISWTGRQRERREVRKEERNEL